jgi:leucyl aminopeptidase
VLQPIAVDPNSISDALADAQSIAIGFIQAAKISEDEKTVYNFPSHTGLIKKLEKTFEIDLRDELAFFSATGKTGEIFEIPVSSDQFAADRILLIGLGDETNSAIRQAGAALGRKGRGKAVTIASLCVSNGLD